MKEKFIDWKPSAESARLLDIVVDIINEYESDGYDLSLRQLYYQMIAQDHFPDTWIDEKYNRENDLEPDTKNTEKSYSRFGDLVGKGRMAGVIDWDMIKDRGREVIARSHWASPLDIMDDTITSYGQDLWATQPCYVEVMVEKQALEGVLIPACMKLDVRFTANKGYSSLSALYEAGQRFEREDSHGKRCAIVYLGDHDPSGIDMSRDVEDRINIFARPNDPISMVRVALNMDQVKRLRPPPNPTKLTDSRSGVRKDGSLNPDGYVARFGRTCWELDALEPRQLVSLVENAVLRFRDEDLWDEAVKKQERGRGELQALRDAYHKTFVAKSKAKKAKKKPKK